MPKVQLTNGAKPTVFPWGVIPAGKTVVLDVSESGLDVIEFAFSKNRIKSFSVLPSEDPGIGTESESEEAPEDDELAEARATFEALTGKKAGRRKLETLLKEISDAPG